jgi:thioredoxin-dependent peroxiredoxin
MRTILALAIAGSLAAAPTCFAQASAQAPAPAPAGAPSGLQAGDTAPAFSLPGTDGATWTLAQFKGKKAVVLAWFPKAFTGG